MPTLRVGDLNSIPVIVKLDICGGYELQNRLWVRGRQTYAMAKDPEGGVEWHELPLLSWGQLEYGSLHKI